MAIASSAWKRLTIVAAGSSTDPPWFRHGNALSDRGTKGSMFLARLTLFLARRSKASRMNDEPWADMARDFHRNELAEGDGSSEPGENQLTRDRSLTLIALIDYSQSDGWTERASFLFVPGETSGGKEKR